MDIGLIILLILPFSFSRALIASSGPLGFEKPRNILCSMGCKCLEKGQSFSLLDCSDAGLYKLPTSLQFERPVSRVNFQGNRITHLNMSTFSMADSVEELDLSNNQITSIENFTLTPFKSLMLLKLSHNRLREASPGLLNGLSDLRVLEIGHNSIQKLSSDTFRDTPNLLELRMQYNPVFNLHENLFEHLPNLERLDLQDTGLVLLPDSIFSRTPRLQWLSLSSNAFEQVPEEALSKAPVLQSLDLSGNDFTAFESGDFRRLSKISLLYLNNLPLLRRIEKDSLFGLDSLHSLSCSFNPSLEYLDEEAFGSQNGTRKRTTPKMQLYLRQNDLRTLKSPMSMDRWSSMSFVDLADNPWKCDCNLQWMRQLKMETQMNVVCDSPPHLHGRSLSTVNISDMVCQEKWTLTAFVLTVAAIVSFGLVVLGATAIVCSRTPVGLYVRAKRQFSYAKVVPKTEAVDLEWDPSADI